MSAVSFFRANTFRSGDHRYLQPADLFRAIAAPSSSLFKGVKCSSMQLGVSKSLSPSIAIFTVTFFALVSAELLFVRWTKRTIMFFFPGSKVGTMWQISTSHIRTGSLRISQSYFAVSQWSTLAGTPFISKFFALKNCSSVSSLSTTILFPELRSWLDEGWTHTRTRTSSRNLHSVHFHKWAK